MLWSASWQQALRTLVSSLLGWLRIAPRQMLSWRGLLILAGALVCAYSAGVLAYVQALPDLGLRSAFGPVLRSRPRTFEPLTPGGPHPEPGDRVVQVGDKTIATWPALLAAPHYVAKEIARPDPRRDWLRKVQREDQVKVHFERETPGQGTVTFAGWCVLERLPIEDLAPAVLWFFLKVMLFLVGALVFWKRPTDRAAAQFFFLCIVTVGAYMGGYHWTFIANQPLLLMVFMVCSVLLPAASLHFYWLFPRPKGLLRDRPRATLTVIYGVPLVFLVLLTTLYIRARWLFQGDASAGDVRAALDALQLAIHWYLGVAALWYLASVVALVHSYRYAPDITEKNQVKWILFGAVVALVPIGYSLYLAVLDPDRFGAGGATWPMFAASLCLTLAFAISITRYRLMELDKIISSGVGYFLVSFAAGVLYFALWFIGWLVLSYQVRPSLSQALTVSTTALILMLALDLARSRLRKALDRRFNREKHQLDRTLRRMGRAIEQLVDPPTMAQRLLQASAELLGVPRGAVYLRQGEPPLYHLAGSLGLPPPLTDLPPGCPLLSALHKGGSVMARPRPGMPLTPAQRQVQFLGGEVAHAFAHGNRLLAVLVLGPRSGSAYHPEDLDLLAGFAQVAVPALESAEGHRKIELLNRELKNKIEKISEQQRRILDLQTMLSQRDAEDRVLAEESGEPGLAASAAPASPKTAAAPGGIVGRSPEVRELLRQVGKVAATDTVVLIHGESGTGKELLARAIHETSPRASKPYVKVHCAALSANLLESELFGHVKGAFTTAHRDKIGRFELANGGTLLLDEIGDISLEVQTKLLRVLQEMTIERVGSSEPVKVDVRILAATHQDLHSLIEQGRFREDLYYRLNVFPILVPPLRNRIEDIPELAMHFLRQSAQRCHKNVTAIDDDALALLKGYSWPGNIRQLENVIERAVVITEGTTVTTRELPGELIQAVDEHEVVPAPVMANGAHEAVAAGVGAGSARLARQRRERERLVQALTSAGGNKAEAARALGLARSTLISRLKKYGLS